MASSLCLWTAILFITVATNVKGVFGRAVGKQGFLSQSPTDGDGVSKPVEDGVYKPVGDEVSKPVLRTHVLRRWRRQIMEDHRDRCAELAAPWMESTEPPPQDNADLLRLHVRPFTPGRSHHGTIFPGKSLFSFVRRVYRCCQLGFLCRGVKGIQGRFSGDTDVDFLLSRDVFSMAVMKAEIHLQFLNPQHLDIQPVLPYMAKRKLPTRYSVWSRGDTAELRVDLLFLFQGLQEAAGGVGGGLTLVNMRRLEVLPRGGLRERQAPQTQDTHGDLWGDGFGHLFSALELGLALSCNKAGLGVSCEHNGVHLSHAPFISLSYHR